MCQGLLKYKLMNENNIGESKTMLSAWCQLGGISEKTKLVRSFKLYQKIIYCCKEILLTK